MKGPVELRSCTFYVGGSTEIGVQPRKLVKVLFGVPQKMKSPSIGDYPIALRSEINIPCHQLIVDVRFKGSIRNDPI
jgi:hypothetical protein